MLFYISRGRDIVNEESYPTWSICTENGSTLKVRLYLKTIEDLLHDLGGKDIPTDLFLFSQ